MAEKTAEELKALLGEDYEGYITFKAAKDKKAKVNAAKASATAMVSDGGKYFESYNRLTEQLDAIWDKALREARKAEGITEEEETPAA